MDEPVVVDRLDEALHRLRVTRLGRADEVVVRNAEAPPGPLELTGHPVDPVLRVHSLRLGGTGDLQAVLVDSGEEEHLVADEPVPARQGVGDDRRVGGPEVGRSVT